MTYWWLNLVFLAVASAVLLAAVRLTPRPGRVVTRWAVPIAAAGASVLVLTIVFDNVMIDIGLVSYASSAISGMFLGAAPVEDFAYPVAGMILLPSLWLLFGRRGARDR
ncbi:lycopene cyclase domain-containing protein [Lysinimonas soli]|uniref:Lycopene cyclase domain-containing protein n=1 Tax=Lysinimonas soli TaxID=1074233 RepID=A0ABW0NRM3_9MICO